MADVVNLRKWRAARARAEKEAEATVNRARFGRTRAEKARDADAQARRDALLDQARLETDPPRE